MLIAVRLLLSLVTFKVLQVALHRNSFSVFDHSVTLRIFQGSSDSERPPEAVVVFVFTAVEAGKAQVI